ncbi:RED-like protein N-terminal region-domain-containing protein, partial [Gloeopeniophorella convolvens]
KTVSASEPAFKPRKVKTQSDAYRDRAEERRLGKEGDFAQVEAVLEEFERRNADNEDKATVDAQRRYLGGDSDHTILVKGLDFALLEQNKARLASVTSKQDDEALEEVFTQTVTVSSASTTRKRSRADIIKELKEKRAAGSPVEQPDGDTETAQKQPNPSKFRPIGFKPIGAPAGEKSRRKKTKEGGEPKKKKRKVEPAAAGGADQSVPKDGAAPSADPVAAADPTLSTSAPTKLPPEAEPIVDDFDIFADAGEYKGMEFDSDDEDGGGSDVGRAPGTPRAGPASAAAESAPGPSRRGWFDDPAEPEPEPKAPPLPPAPAAPSKLAPEAEVDAEEEQEVRLAPLASSAIPSIREFLAMDEAAEKEKKRRARKEKRKGKNKEDEAED